MPYIPHKNVVAVEWDNDNIDLLDLEEQEPVRQKRYCQWIDPIKKEKCPYSLADLKTGNTCLHHPIDPVPQQRSRKGYIYAEKISRSGSKPSTEKTHLSPKEVATHSRDVLHAVYQVYKIQVSDLRGKHLEKSEVEARQVAVYLLYTVYDLPRKTIARLAHMNTTTAYNCCDKISMAIQRDDSIAERVRQIQAILQDSQTVSRC